MNISIKDHIINNFKDEQINEIKEAIEDSITSQDEITLPGLGIFFTLAWQNSNDTFKKNILNNIKKGLI